VKWKVGSMRVGLSIALVALGLLWMGIFFGSAYQALSLIAPMSLFAFGIGIIGPATIASALTVDNQAVGAASSLFGALQMGICAAGTALIAALSITNARGLVMLLSFSILSAIIAFPAIRSVSGRPTSAPTLK
jgi:DHA1 family bicyclomycin/chloramphenicol resistance-like MFS transporter